MNESSLGLRDWVRSGAPWIWLNAGAIATCLVMIAGLLVLIAVRGLGQFWPAPLAEVTYTAPGEAPAHLIGRFDEAYTVTASRARELGFELPAGRAQVTRHLIKVGNRDVDSADFRWLTDLGMGPISHPKDLIAVERTEWGDLYGRLTGLMESGQRLPAGTDLRAELGRRLARSAGLVEQIRIIEKSEIGSINYGIEQLRLEERGLALRQSLSAAEKSRLAAARAQFEQRYEELRSRLEALRADAARDAVVVTVSSGAEVTVPLEKVVRAYHPNEMSLVEKSMHYVVKMWEFVSEDPREANTEGGVFPAIFGTVLMVLIMAVLVTPFGVIAAVYLREYARQTLFTRIIRIAVNNLAGVPSVVYGVFGLGFFVYFLGGSIDRLFYAEALPAPTFGTPGLLWSSLTLALLTVPVVIVATEEGLARIPRSIREGSLALGATKAETLWRTVLPMATPGMMTGLILAVARAAGEVAPLMLVGVVKLAPTLPLDGDFPYLHLERKFMHLGFHIYDVGFQSPNVDAARPLVYATALLLVLVIVVLNLSAVRVRNRLRDKYNVAET